MAAGPSIAARLSVPCSRTFPGVSQPAFLLQTAQSIGSASGSPGVTRRCGAPSAQQRSPGDAGAARAVRQPTPSQGLL